jgi:hypothetical protein
MARLASILKQGFYPALPEAIAGILRHLKIPDPPPDQKFKPEDVNILDPCAGEAKHHRGRHRDRRAHRGEGDAHARGRLAGGVRCVGRLDRGAEVRASAPRKHVDGCGNRPGLAPNQGQGCSACMNGTPMKLVITIALDNSAFNGKDCGRELARILQMVTDRVDLESTIDLIRGYHDDPMFLFDINGNRVGSMEIADD